MMLQGAPFGIKQEYTFYQDFQIADQIGGEAAVLDTYKRVKAEWSDNPQAWGEVVCALNWRLWDLHETHETVARLYEKLWSEAQSLGWKKGNKDKSYATIFLQVTD